MNEQEAHEMLSRIDERTLSILQRLEQQDQRLNSHGSRLIAIEHWQSKLAGASAALGAVIGSAVSVAMGKFKGH